MRSIKNYVQAEKARREELGEEGFSLIELIVVVVILGILAAVAIPVFLGLQDQAEQTAQDAVAANAASQAAAAFASDEIPDPVADAAWAPNLVEGDTEITIALGTGATAIAADAEFGIDTFCVTVKGDAAEDSLSGPGCGVTADDDGDDA